MISILQNLEPIHLPKKTQIARELDEFGEVIFVEKGLIYIGYEINKKKKYCVKYNGSCVIGGFGATFDQRSSFIYISVTESTGNFIRKQNWKDILEEYPDIAKKLK